MATPMTPDQILKAFRDEGLTVVEVPGWRARCRCCPDTVAHRPAGPFVRGWGDVKGQLAHITAGGLGNRTVLKYIADIINGDKATPTKSQTVIPDEKRTVYVNSAGRCNHAGKVGISVRSHMIAADFSTTDDFDNRFTGGSVDGNAFTYGDEVIAAKSMSADQRETLVMAHAARARFHGWTGQESVGHGEVSNQRGKGDPNLDMGKFRRDVMARVKSGSAVTPPVVTPEPDPVPEVPTDVSLTWLQKLAQMVADAIAALTPKPSEPPTTYTVKRGDSLGKIAAATKVSVADLVAWNKIKNPNVINVGQVLRLTKPPTITTTMVTANLAGTVMTPGGEGAYGVKGRVLADRVAGIAALALTVDPDLFGTTESGTLAGVKALSAELTKQSGHKWASATSSENASDSLRLALHYRTDVWEFVSQQVVKTPGPNHNTILRVTLRNLATGLPKVVDVIHYYHHEGPENDLLRGQQAAASKGADIVMGDRNTAIEDKGDKTQAAYKAVGLVDVETISTKRVNDKVNTAPGGKVLDRQIDGFSVPAGSTCEESGVLLENDLTDHQGFAYARNVTINA